MNLCETCIHRQDKLEGETNDWCGLNGKWIPIDDCTCVNHKKPEHDIQTGLAVN